MHHHDPEDMQQPFSKMSMQTWHPHVYANPPKEPTPHFIIDILGIRDPNHHQPQVVNQTSTTSNNGHFYHRSQHFHNSHSSNSSSSCGSFSPSMAIEEANVDSSKTVIDQPLNLSCPEKVRGETPSPGKLTPFRVVPSLDKLKPPLIHVTVPTLETSGAANSPNSVGASNGNGTNPAGTGTNSVTTGKGKSCF